MKKLLLHTLLVFSSVQFLSAQFTVHLVLEPRCYQDCGGWAEVLPYGSNYRYLWSNGETRATPTDLCAGNYSVTVSDSLGNPLDTVLFTMTQPAPISTNPVISNIKCFGVADGEILINLSGGTLGYSVYWGGSVGSFSGPCYGNDNGYGTYCPHATNLFPGDYIVWVQDHNGCNVYDTFTVIQTVTPLSVSLQVNNTTDCSTTDGSILSTTAGGTPAYSYSWNYGTHTADLTGLYPGTTYDLTVSDALNCSVTGTASVHDSHNVYATVSSVNYIDCTHRTCDVIFKLHNAFSFYVVYWDDGLSDGYNYPDSVAVHSYSYPGIYNISYSDYLCSGNMVDTIVNFGIQINTAVLQQPSCAQVNNGKIKVSISNASPPLFFLWSNGSTADSITNLSAGTYSVTVTDSSGCINRQTYTLHNPSNFSTSASGTFASCVNGGIGNATIATSGGSAPYTYLWGTVPVQTTQTATNIPPGNYSYTVTDHNGCAVANTAHIYFSSYSFFVNMNVYNQPNCGLHNGSLWASTNGGVYPYTYHWSTNQTTQSIYQLGAGNYSVTVTDGGGCTASGTSQLTNSCYNTIRGNLFNDENINCVFDSSDTYLSGYTVSASNGVTTAYGTTDVSGYYSIAVPDTGTFSLHITHSGNGICGNLVPCGSTTVSFHSFNNYSPDLNYVTNGNTAYNLATHPGWSSANPGFPKEIWILPYNHSNYPFTGNATVSFVYDSNLTYQYSLPPLPAHNLATHTLTWVLNSVPFPFYDWNSRLRNFFQVSASVPLNYLLQSDFYISPTTGDCDSSDNHLHFSEIVTGSHDPNEKTVSPSGSMYEEDSVLTYSIHFQNSGNDTTWFITLKDTLDANLDPGSVQNLASSHPYTQFNISGNGILTWTFNPIFLVDSATNPDASKGFVTFSVKRKSNWNLGAIISNRASVYFDYAEPVLTNKLETHQCYSSINNSSAEVCGNELFDFYGTALDTNGVYLHTAQSVYGCDSIVQLWFTRLQPSSAYINTAVCSGENFYVGNHVHGLAGIFTDTLQNVNGCDSVVILQLEVFDKDSSSSLQAICAGESFDFYGSSLSSAGVYSHVFQNVHGCDSVLQLSLNVIPPQTSIIDIITQDSSYTLPSGAIVSMSGTYIDTLVASNTCDSIVTTFLHLISGISNLSMRNVDFRLNPNPANNSVFISMDESMLGAMLTITDVRGRSVAEVELSAINTQLSIAQFAQGVYFVTIENETGMLTRKLVKQ